MNKDKQAKKTGLKAFFQSVVEKIDKKMEEKSKDKKCCGPEDKPKDSGSCCN